MCTAVLVSVAMGLLAVAPKTRPYPPGRSTVKLRSCVSGLCGLDPCVGSAAGEACCRSGWDDVVGAVARPAKSPATASITLTRPVGAVIQFGTSRRTRRFVRGVSAELVAVATPLPSSVWHDSRRCPPRIRRISVDALRPWALTPLNARARVGVGSSPERPYVSSRRGRACVRDTRPRATTADPAPKLDRGVWLLAQLLRRLRSDDLVEIEV